MSWDKMSIGKKIGIGFGAVLLLLAILVALSDLGVSNIVTDAEEVIDGNKLDTELAQKEVDHLNWANKVNALLTDDNVTTLEVQTDDHKCAFGKWLYGEGRKQAEKLVPSLAPLFIEIETPHRHLHESALEIGNNFHQADLEVGNFLREKKADHLEWAHKVKDVFVDASLNTIEAEKDPKQCGLGKWMYSPETVAMKNADPTFAVLWDKLEEPHKTLHEGAATIQEMLDGGQRDNARAFYMGNTKPLTYECLNKIDALLKWHDEKVEGMNVANTIYAEKTFPALQNTQQLLNDIRIEAKKHIMTDQVMLGEAQKTKFSVTTVGVIAIVAGILLAFFISKGLIRLLRTVANQMDVSAEQVAAASSQVSSASQSLAEGAAEQAAGVEETSSSLEEMASMTRQNSENANQADALMKDTNQVVSKANDSMGKLIESMADISKSSEETSKIIKTIDEIAFQTNLLALNAAVEAARAGDAGAGFAVVADEVRNLAMRAAEAAKNTSELIEGSVKKINIGGELVASTNEDFSQVAKNASKVANLLGEIAAASNEQAQGIEQINTAVAEVDRITQQNAASAEESASASEEMNAQAEQMKESVLELLAMLGNAQNGNGNNRGRMRPSLLSDDNFGHRTKSIPALSKTGQRKKALPDIKKVTSGQVIPMEDKDFKDF